MKDRICQIVEQNRDLYCKVSREIWGTPELTYKEFRSSAILVDLLRDNGFRVETGICGMPTAFKASFGSGNPVIGFLAEFDALAGLSQESGKAEVCPIVPGGPGHGCGHNTIGTSCAGAAITLKQMLEETNRSGTVIVFGCPAEEQGSGKAFMARAHIFDGTDVAISPHPMAFNSIMGFSSLANVQVEFHFTGKAAHASSQPHMGRSALDAADLMIVGVQFLREHITSEARLHHAYLDVGGTSPNVVQASAKLLFYIRAPKAEQVREIYDRVKDVARGAAIMTGTSVEVELKSGMCDFIPNDTLGRVAAECWQEIGSCAYSPAAMEIAARIAPTLGLNPQDALIDTSVPNYMPVPKPMSSSTDIGDVSYTVPTIAVLFAGVVKNTPGHSWQYVAQSSTPLMHDGMIHATKVMAYTAMKVCENPLIAEQAKAELMEKTSCKYISLIPDEIQPDL